MVAAGTEGRGQHSLHRAGEQSPSGCTATVSSCTAASLSNWLLGTALIQRVAPRHYPPAFLELYFDKCGCGQGPNAVRTTALHSCPASVGCSIDAISLLAGNHSLTQSVLPHAGTIPMPRSGIKSSRRQHSNHSTALPLRCSTAEL
jgi:hypothetical protein